MSAEDIVTRLARMPIAEWEDARQEIVKLRAMVENAGGAVSSVISSVEAIASEGSTAFTELQTAYNEILVDKQKLEDQFAELKTNFTALREQFEEATKSANVAKAQEPMVSRKDSVLAVQTVVNQVVDLQKELAASKDQLATVAANAEAANQSNIAIFRQQIADLMTQLEVAKANPIKVVDTTLVTNLQSALSEASSEKDVLISKLNELQSKYDGSIIDITDLKTKLAGAVAKADSLVIELTVLKSKVGKVVTTEAVSVVDKLKSFFK
jgi:phage shock protein A